MKQYLMTKNSRSSLLNQLSLAAIATIFLTSTMAEAKSCEIEKMKLGTPELEVQVTFFSQEKSQNAPAKDDGAQVSPENSSTDKGSNTNSASNATTSPSRKALVIVPPTGRTNYIDRRYAKLFCKAGYDVYIMDQWTNDEETTTELEIHERFYGQAQKAISIVINQIPKNSYVGLIGTSVGGLHAVIAANYQERLDAVFVITAGISVAEVVVNSDQKAMVYLNSERKKNYNLKTDEEVLAAIGTAFTYEPTQLTERYKTRSLGMVIGLQDKTVPTATQKKLEEYWKPKKVINYKNDHFWTIVKAWLFTSDEILEFFEESYNSQQAKTTK